MAALAGGAKQVVGVDSSAPALAKASANVALNGFDADRHQAVDADVNQFLRQQLQEGAHFDAIVLDRGKIVFQGASAELLAAPEKMAALLSVAGREAR